MADITAGERFTPGPWRDGTDGNHRVYGPDGRGEHSGLIAVVYKGRANARLIAAAPDLYEACRVALGYLTCGMDGNWLKDVDPVDVLRAALSRAEGQS